MNSEVMTSVSSVNPLIRWGGHLTTNGCAAPVSTAPVLFGKSWLRGVYAACVSRAKGMSKAVGEKKKSPQQMKTATSPDVSVDRCSAGSPRTCAAMSGGCHSSRF